jgi:hypothetical protein
MTNGPIVSRTSAKGSGAPTYVAFALSPRRPKATFAAIIEAYDWSIHAVEDRTASNLRWTLALLWTSVFLYLLVALNPADSEFVSLAGSWSQLIGLKPGALMKVGHVAGYVLLVVLWCGALSTGYRERLPRKTHIWLLISILLLAAATEALQGLNPNRHPAWLDVGYNVLGALIGFGLRQLLVRKEAKPHATPQSGVSKPNG